MSRESSPPRHSWVSGWKRWKKEDHIDIDLKRTKDEYLPAKIIGETFSLGIQDNPDIGVGFIVEEENWTIPPTESVISKKSPLIRRKDG